MIILIGGASHTGKTLMAQKLLEKYKFPYLSIDHLKMGLYRANIGCGFTPLDSFELIGEKIWPILKEIVKINIENRQNLIIEGSYLLPRKIDELQTNYFENIISFYLTFSKLYIKNRLETDILAHRCVIESREYENDFTIEDFISENEFLKTTCSKHGVKCFEIDNAYENEIQNVFTWIDEQLLKAKGEITNA